jgi:oxygen-independent coproporphyrinogen-3 oxidase
MSDPIPVSARTAAGAAAAVPRLAPALRIDPETVRRFDRPGPRYTSYPTAVEFHGGVGEADYRERLARADDAGEGAALGLYVHIPFCAKHCSYCGCHVVATERRDVAARYLDDLARELALSAACLPRRRTLAQMHWGGGTPTYLEPDQLERLFAEIADRFRIAPGAEVAIEVDPRVTTLAQLETLRRLGFNRLSFGVQDFTPEVQAAIARGQTFEETRALLAVARELGFDEGVNFDLVYGLPFQTEASFRASLERVVELRPDRLALYSFAYVPWVRPNQRRLDASALPEREAKLALYLAALERLLAAGYEPIGMDHFALPDDELARAARDGRLDRNFMGYTVKPAATSIAFGVSGIGEVAGGYFANERKLSRYGAAVATGRLPIERGYLLDSDDVVRQYVIRQLMCNFRVAKREVERRFGIAFDAYFAESLARLDEPIAEGFVTLDAESVAVEPAGRLFVRNVCMAFDRYLDAQRGAERPVFSRTV